MMRNVAGILNPTRQTPIWVLGAIRVRSFNVVLAENDVATQDIGWQTSAKSWRISATTKAWSDSRAGES